MANDQETEERKSQYIIRDKFGKPYGLFNSAQAAARWANSKWPGEEQDSERTGKGWDIEVLMAGRMTTSSVPPDAARSG